jgi:MoaA/NifB/PqqE/SkfB family radical SAM enzyme
MKVNGIPKLSLCGGEPFLFDGLVEVAGYAGKNNIRCTVTTNGMTAHRLNENELNILKKSKAEINISIDSFREDIQSLTRGNNSALQNALQSVRKLSEKRIPVTVLTVISKFNFRILSEHFISAYNFGIKQVLFQPVIYYSNYPGLEPVDHKVQLNVSADHLDALMEELKKILQFERKHQIKTNVYRIFPWIKSYLETANAKKGRWFFSDVLNKFYCREIDAIIDITYDGGIQPCGLVPASITIHENRQEGLVVLWLKATQQIREDLSHYRYYPVCNGCCHHFSRNMLASIAKYPVKNRLALLKMMPLVLSRMQSGLLKKISIHS